MKSHGNLRKLISKRESEFNKVVTDGLLLGAKKAFNDNNGKELIVFKVPGAFEIAATTKKVAKELNPDAIVTLGAIIKGETKHFNFIASLPQSQY